LEAIYVSSKEGLAKSMASTGKRGLGVPKKKVILFLLLILLRLRPQVVGERGDAKEASLLLFSLS
jgi:hypothetical protein